MVGFEPQAKRRFNSRSFMMFKKIWVCLQLLAVSTFAVALPNYDFVKTAQINSLEMTKPQSLDNVRLTFGKPNKVSKPVWSECTGNADVTAEFPDKDVRLEYFSEDNPTGIKPTNAKSKAMVWINWPDFKRSKDVLVLGKVKINSQFNFTQFKQNFPHSARNVAEQSDGDMSSYLVLLGEQPNNEEFPYRAAVEFVYRGNTLIILNLHQGIAC